MARYLQQLLGAKGPLFEHAVKKLEQATGNRGIDAQLIGDIQTKAYAVMRALKLDPKDTTTSELYKALHGTIPKNTLKNTEYVGLVTTAGVVSFNANDVKRNKNRSMKERTLDAMRQSLLAELVQRYEAVGRETSEHIKELVASAGVQALKIESKKKGK